MLKVGDLVIPTSGFKHNDPMEVIGLAEKSGKHIAWVAFYDTWNTGNYAKIKDGSGRCVIGIEVDKLRKIDGTN